MRRKYGSIASHYLVSLISVIRASAGPPSFKSSPILYLQYLLTPYTARDGAGFARTTWFQTKGSGYSAEQSTRPQTLGYSLADSPVGLLAWIYEKLVEWTDSYPWADDEGDSDDPSFSMYQLFRLPLSLPSVLEWVSIYWFSRAGPAASVRIYYEVGFGDFFPGGQPNSVPLGLSFFPKELLVVPKTCVSYSQNYQ